MPKLKALLNNIQRKPIVGALIIAAFYFFGTFGILLGFGNWFVPKTAFNLLLSFLILIIYQEELSYKLLLALLICYFVGFTAEFLGVQYGLIFGDYYYPDTLGPQLLGVPLVIGINWYLITFVVWNSIVKIRLNPFIKIFLASLLTTLIDVIIEPVAIALDFWKWEAQDVPIQNYVGWFVISLIIFSSYHLIKIPSRNVLAKHLLFWQLFFFIMLNLFL